MGKDGKDGKDSKDSKDSKESKDKKKIDPLKAIEMGIEVQTEILQSSFQTSKIRGYLKEFKI